MSRVHRRLFLLAGLWMAFPTEASGTSWDVSSNMDLQMRFFTQDARWPGQAPQSGQLSIAASAEFRWNNEEGDRRASLIPYLRWDEVDDERSLIDLREAYWAWQSDTYELLIGANTVFWGVTESVHLVDIIDQTDAVADIDGEDKLGQPMVNFDMQQDWGRLSIYVMPYFRERTFAGPEGRLRTPVPVDTANPQFESSAGKHNLDIALRYAHYVGNIDVGLSVFSGTSREPRLLPNADGSALSPIYDQIHQFGVDLQYTKEAWLWKLEAIVRDGVSDTFSAMVGGFEYTFYQVGDSAADVGLLLEYQHDGRDRGEPVTVSDNDVFLGVRLALNDTQDTAALVGLSQDLDTSEIFFNMEAERRLGDAYVLEMRWRMFSGAGPGDATYPVTSDDYVQLQLSRYF